MIKIIAKVKVKPELKSDFIQMCQPLIESSNKEVGNISYGLFQNQRVENRLAFIEEWKDQIAIEFHNDTEEFKKVAAVLNQFLESPFEVEHYIEL